VHGTRIKRLEDTIVGALVVVVLGLATTTSAIILSKLNLGGN